jgi:hypothetical protein
MPNRIGARIAKAGLIVLLLALCGGSAFADLAFPVSGLTTGDFYLGTVDLGSSIPLSGLSFTGNTFSGTNPSINLGTFSLAALASWFDPYDFKLSVNFLAPATSGTVFKADLNGVVSFVGGSAKIDFANNGPTHFAFTNGQGSGSFDLSIADVKVGNWSSASIMGTISNATFAATPEPTAVILTSALLGGVIVLFRKRLQRS